MALKFEDNEVYGVEASESGEGNGVYLDYCEVAWHRPAYAACLNKIAQRKEGRLGVQFAACSAAIGKKSCPAMKLRAEELAKGQAIYFLNRIKLAAFNQYTQEMAGQAFATSVDKDNTRKAKRASKHQGIDDEYVAPKPIMREPEIEVGYAAAINSAIKNSEKPEIKASNDDVVKSVAVATSGMSLLELARHKLNFKG